MQRTTIKWTGNTGMSWNPFGGCSHKSKGCRNCYAEVYENRFHEIVPKLKGTITNGRFNGIINLDDKELMRPTKRKTPTVFFISMSDPFHEHISFQDIDRVFEVMKKCPQHTFLLLTKRPERIKEYYREVLTKNFLDADVWTGDDYYPLPNVWLGTSVENQHSAKRVYDLLQCPAIGHFVSAEPLLGIVDLENIFLNLSQGLAFFNAYTGELSFAEEEEHEPIELPYKLKWVIAGGESGANKKEVRPMHPLWARSLRAQTTKYSVDFFFKQWGCYKPKYIDDNHLPTDICINEYGSTDTTQQGDFVPFVWVGKEKAGRLLDGKEHNDLPFNK